MKKAKKVKKEVVEYFEIKKLQFPVVLGTKSVQSMYGSKAKHPMLGVVFDFDKGFACSFCNKEWLKSSEKLKKASVAHEIGHICCGHNPTYNKDITPNHQLTKEHQADMYAVKILGKKEVVECLTELYEIGKKKNDLLAHRLLLLDDSWEGPLPVLEVSKEDEAFAKKHKCSIKDAWKMFNSVDLGQK